MATRRVSSSHRGRVIGFAAIVAAALLLSSCGGGATEDSPETDDTVLVKNGVPARPKQCVSTTSGNGGPLTAEAREKALQAQKECLEQARANSTTTTVKKKP